MFKPFQRLKNCHALGFWILQITYFIPSLWAQVPIELCHDVLTEKLTILTSDPQFKRSSKFSKNKLMVKKLESMIFLLKLGKNFLNTDNLNALINSPKFQNMIDLYPAFDSLYIKDKNVFNILAIINATPILCEKLVSLDSLDHVFSMIQNLQNREDKILIDQIWNFWQRRNTKGLEEAFKLIISWAKERRLERDQKDNRLLKLGLGLEADNMSKDSKEEEICERERLPGNNLIDSTNYHFISGIEDVLLPNGKVTTGLSHFHTKEIVDFVEDHRSDWMKGQNDLYLSHIETKLPVDIEFRREGQIFLHLLPLTSGGKVGQGSFKTFLKTLDYDTGELFARVEFDWSAVPKTKKDLEKREDAKKEIKFLKKVNGFPFMIQTHKIYETLKDITRPEHKVQILLQPYFVMDMLTAINNDPNENSISLLGISKTQPKFSNQQILDIAIDLVKGLITLHKEIKIFHKDIKPENILLGKIPRLGMDKIFVVYIDFGLSTATDDLKGRSTLSGTLKYISPRFYSNSLKYAKDVHEHDYPQSIDVKSSSTKSRFYQEGDDIWSLGIVLYILANPKAPYWLNYSKSNINLTAGALDELYDDPKTVKSLFKKNKKSFFDFLVRKNQTQKQSKFLERYNTILEGLMVPTGEKQLSLNIALQKLKNLRKSIKKK